MKIGKIKIRRVTPNKGLVAFASCTLDDSLFIGNIAIFTRLGREEEIRLVFPVKEINNSNVPIFYPLTSDLYFQLENAILDKFRNQ